MNLCCTNLALIKLINLFLYCCICKSMYIYIYIIIFNCFFLPGFSFVCCCLVIVDVGVFIFCFVLNFPFPRFSQCMFSFIYFIVYTPCSRYPGVGVFGVCMCVVCGFYIYLLLYI